MIVYCLHGFLGLPSDWEDFLHVFPMATLRPLSITDFLPPVDSLLCGRDVWQYWLNSFQKKISEDPVNEQKVILGYSLGGRLALHALRFCGPWAGAVLISTNLGLLSEEEKLQRRCQDALWAARFLGEPWDKVMDSWNAQGVFSGGSHVFKRLESQFCQKQIAQILNHFSLGNQDDFRDDLLSIQIPVLWLAGALDGKFAQQARFLSGKNPFVKVCIESEAGHRLPWDIPLKFQSLCKDFFSSILTERR